MRPWRPQNSDSGESGLASCMCNPWGCTALLLRSALRPEPGSILCCRCLAIVSFCYWGPRRQRDVHISRGRTWKAGKSFIFFVPEGCIFAPAFWSTFSFCTGPHQFCELVLQAGMWMYEPVIPVDPGFSRVTDAHGQAPQSHSSGRCKGSKKDFGNKWESSWFLKEELDECEKGLRQKEQTV